MKSSLFVLFCCLFNIAFSQLHTKAPFHNGSEPEWVQLMYAENTTLLSLSILHGGIYFIH